MKSVRSKNRSAVLVVPFGMEFSKYNVLIYECFVVGLGIPPVPGANIPTPVYLITVKLCTCIICFAYKRKRIRNASSYNI
jgi:hypothetical protein